MGASDAQVQALLSNRWYSLSVLTALVTDLERLSGVVGRPEVLALAATATKEGEARFLAAAVHLLARLNVTGVPIRRVTGRGTVVGVAADGGVVVPAPSWTTFPGRSGPALSRRGDLRASRRGIWLTGRMSGAAHQGFTGLGWTLHDVTLPAGTR